MSTLSSLVQDLNRGAAIVGRDVRAVEVIVIEVARCVAVLPPPAEVLVAGLSAIAVITQPWTGRLLAHCLGISDDIASACQCFAQASEQQLGPPLANHMNIRNGFRISTPG